jgi:hypothetical protein
VDRDGAVGRPIARDRIGRWTGGLLLAVLPLLLIASGYYRHLLLGHGDWPVSGDAAFYAYQFARAGELGRRWWDLGQDELVGAPFQPEFGKHPGVFEGLDLLLVSTLTSRWLDPVANYHLLMMLVMAASGWIVGGMVRRLTGSWAWAALGVILVTWNFSTAFRLQGHAHLFKYGWTVLAVAAFSRYLDRPTVRRGIVLGLSMALVLQGSFYLGAFLGMACGVWWLGCLMAGHLSRQHLAAAAAALACFTILALAATFPVWSPARTKLLTDAYGGHGRIDAWKFSAELWQYLLPPDSKFAASYLEEFDARFHPQRQVMEGWHYPGLTVLLAISAYLLSRLRGRTLPVAEPRLIDRFMGLAGILVLFSLAGGPSFFLVSGIGCFRAYGRAGLLALALLCVAAPVILQAAVRYRPAVRLRNLVCPCLIALALYEGYRAAAWYPWNVRMEIPAWVDWLAQQPPEVRLAAFPPAHERAGDRWGYDSLLYRVKHHHASLNGSDSLLLAADLKLLGATYETMNPAGLRFVASLGYDHLAFHREYLESNPWIRSLPWLETVETRGEWWFHRVTPRLERLPRMTLDEVLASSGDPKDPIDVPADAWITDRFALAEDVVVGPSRPVQLGWTDERDRLVDRPSPALYQHVFGPGIPAFSAKTPKAPGEYRLVFLDEHSRPIRSRPYRVRRDLETIISRIDSRTERPVAGQLVTARVVMNGETPEVVVENRSPYYLQANTSRDQVYLKSARNHPGTMGTSAGSLVLRCDEFTILLPCDVPAGGRVKLPLPPGFMRPMEDHGTASLMPHFLDRGEPLGESPTALQAARGHEPLKRRVPQRRVGDQSPRSPARRSG